MKFKFLLSHPFCIPMHDAKCLVTGSSTLSSPGHQKMIRAAVSRIGWALSRLGARHRPILAAAHQTTLQRSKDNCTAMLSLIRRQPIFYLRNVGCVIRFRRLRFLLRVASFPRIAVLPSWRVHPTRVCVLRFHHTDGLSFRNCEHHLPDCYDLHQGVFLFRLHNCWELQVLLFHLICRCGWPI